MSMKKLSPSRPARVALATMSVAVLLFAGNAMADQEPAQTVVRYHDLDLENQQGASALYARLENAARQVCRAYEGRELIRKKLQKECETQALADAVDKVSHAAVTSLHNHDQRIRVAEQRSRNEDRS